MIVQIELKDEEELDWLEAAAIAASRKFFSQFNGKAGTGMSRNRAGRFGDYMNRIVDACKKARNA